MIIYSPHKPDIIKQREKQIKNIFKNIPTKHCFITGSYLWKEDYNDIDLFIISRKKDITTKNKLIKKVILDFNNLYSLFYHSISKSCISKNILPSKPAKATISDYWQVINEAIPTILNEKDKYHKNIRFLVLYTEYFKNSYILDSYELTQKIKEFKDHIHILDYVNKELPKIISNKNKKSYIKKFFYTQAGYYKESLEYDSIRFLYELSHSIISLV